MLIWGIRIQITKVIVARFARKDVIVKGDFLSDFQTLCCWFYEKQISPSFSHLIGKVLEDGNTPFLKYPGDISTGLKHLQLFSHAGKSHLYWCPIIHHISGFFGLQSHSLER